MKNRNLLVLAIIIILLLTSTITLANGNTLDDILNNLETENQAGLGNTKKNNPNYEKNKSFIEGLKGAGDLSADVEGASVVTEKLKYGVSFLVQIIAYATVILMALRVAIDLAFIALPFARGFLGNGYVGNAQAGAGGMPGSMGIQSGMGMGMGRMGGMGNQIPGSQQGMALGGDAGQQPSASGRIQWVSNSALNAIAGENTVGPDGKAVNPFKLYVKDMIIVFIMVPILLTLAVTGALSSLGLLLGEVIVGTIQNLGSMI